MFFIFLGLQKLPTPSTPLRKIYTLTLFHEFFVIIFLCFSFFILFVVIFILHKIKSSLDLICQIEKLIKTISNFTVINAKLFFQNLKILEHNYEDVENVLAEIPGTLGNKAYKMMSPPPTRPTRPMRPPPPPPMHPPPPPPPSASFHISSEELEESIYSSIKVFPLVPTESTGAIPKRRAVSAMRKSSRIYENMNELEETKIKTETKLNQTKLEGAVVIEQQDEVAKLDVIVEEKIVNKPKIRTVVTTKHQDEQQDKKAAAASKLGRMVVETKKEKKLNDIEMNKIDSKPETQSENVNVISENTFFLFRMIKNRRFENLIKKCCNNNKCNCVSK